MLKATIMNCVKRISEILSTTVVIIMAAGSPRCFASSLGEQSHVKRITTRAIEFGIHAARHFGMNWVVTRDSPSTARIAPPLVEYRLQTAQISELGPKKNSTAIQSLNGCFPEPGEKPDIRSMSKVLEGHVTAGLDVSSEIRPTIGVPFASHLNYPKATYQKPVTKTATLFKSALNHPVWSRSLGPVPFILTIVCLILFELGIIVWCTFVMHLNDH
jgi:hypothetical protein